MPNPASPAPGDLTPRERRRQVAAILAQGALRHCRNDELSPSRDTGLEVVSKTRLSVCGVRTTETRAWENEVKDE